MWRTAGLVGRSGPGRGTAAFAGTALHTPPRGSLPLATRTPLLPNLDFNRRSSLAHFLTTTRRRVSFHASHGVVRSQTMESAAARARRHRRLALYGVASLGSVVGLCVLGNDELVALAVQLTAYPYSRNYSLDLLSLLLLHEPNRDVAIDRGILTILAALPDDVELAMKGLSVLATLCSSEQHQEMIAKQWRPALLVLSGVENEAVAVLACSALARLAQHDKNPTMVLSKQHMQPLLTLAMVGKRGQQTDAAKAIRALSPFGPLMDHEAQSVVIEATNMLLLSKYVEPQAEALHTLSRLSRFDSWRSIIAERGCLYNMLLGINGRLSDSSRKWALKSLVHFADDRNYRLRVGEGGLSSIIKTTIKNPYDEVKAPAVTILAILASNDSYRNRILGTKVLDKIVGYLQSHNEKLRTQSAHLLVHLAATDESRKRAADLNAVEAVVALFDQAPTENARLYSVAAMGQLALTASVRRRLGDSGAVDAIGRYLENTTSSTSATRAHCFAALVQLSFDDELKAKMKNAALLGVLLSSSESSDLEEQMWALRALLHLSLDGDGKAKLQQLRCGNVMEQIRRRTKKAEVKLLAEEVLASLKAPAAT